MKLILFKSKIKNIVVEFNDLSPSQVPLKASRGVATSTK